MDQTQGFVRVGGLRIFYRSFGEPSKGTLLAIHGTGGTHAYLTPLADLVQFGYRVVMFDQRGLGKSAKPRGARYYTERLAVEEVEGVRRALKLGRVHLFGNSYGGALVLDVALRYPNGLRSLIVSSGYASETLLNQEFARMTLPTWVKKTLAKYEATGDFQHPKYLEAFDVVWKTHYCRLPVWPYDFWYMIKHANFAVDHHRMKGWDITAHLPKIKVPCLVTVGKYDSVTPKCSRVIHRGIRGSKLVVFQRSSHVAFWEERDHYMDILHRFLDQVK
jgi:proline iminopeptidase